MNPSTASLASSHTAIARNDNSLRDLREFQYMYQENMGVENRAGSERDFSSYSHSPRSTPDYFPRKPIQEDGPISPAADGGEREVVESPVIRKGPERSGGPPGGPAGPSAVDLYQPKSLKFWLILVSNFLAMFLVALDRTIVATATPRITDDFHSLGDVGWYGSAYMLTTAASQLLFGRLYKHYNMKWVFLITIVIFEVGSAICGAAPSSPVFIFGRAIAGFGSAGIFSGAMMIMIPMIPLHKRPMFQSMFGLVFGIASVLGPLVGGAFTSSLTWRWCFWINLPIGGFSLLFMFFFWNPPHRKNEPAPIFTHIKRLDPLGTFFFIPSVVCLLLALQMGGSSYPWGSWRIILLFGFFGVLAICFAIVQILTPETASIPGRIITQRSVFFATSFTFFIAGSMLMLVYYLPIWFQTVKVINALKSGIYTLPLVLALVASSLINGVAVQKLGYYVPSMLLSPAIMAVGEGLLSTLDRSSPQAQWVGFQFMSGFGLGMGMQAGSLAVQTVLPMPDVSMGVALIFFSQQLGGAVFTTVGQTILSNVLVSKLAGIPGIDVGQIVNSGATELVDLVPANEIDQVIDVYNYALTRIFLSAMGLTLVALLSAAGMEWRNIKTAKGKGAGGSLPSGPPPGGPVGASPRASERDIELGNVQRKK